jgi:integrase
MASVYRKKGRTNWWCRLRGVAADAPTKWSARPTPYEATDELKQEALEYAEAAQRTIDARISIAGSSVVTVSSYADRWLTGREARGLVSVDDDRGRLMNHVLPTLGALRIDEVRPHHIRDLIRELLKNEELAPRTVLHIYGVTRTMFHDALTEELIGFTPCVIQRGELPARVDKDPEWRDAATYTIDEVRALITDSRIYVRRRVEYALKALAGLRHGEVAGLRWRNRARGEQPLPKLTISRSYTRKRTKTDVTRLVPEHPTLTLILDWWRAQWPTVYGFEPGPDDLVVPNRDMRLVSANAAGDDLLDDLARLELRVKAGEVKNRGGHDLRAWLISTAIEHGASPEALMRITHTKKKDVQSGYTRLPWKALCAAISELRFEVDPGSFTPVTEAAPAGAPGSESPRKETSMDSDPDGIRTRHNAHEGPREPTSLLGGEPSGGPSTLLDAESGSTFAPGSEEVSQEPAAPPRGGLEAVVTALQRALLDACDSLEGKGEPRVGAWRELAYAAVFVPDPLSTHADNIAALLRSSALVERRPEQIAAATGAPLQTVYKTLQRMRDRGEASNAGQRWRWIGGA